jgi:DNA-binding NtrC family response regulator
MSLHKPTINILTHVLDDDHDFKIIVSRILEKHPDIEYKLYSEIGEFLESIKETKNISIIDYNLKADMNGLELMKIILGKNPLSYVIMMSNQTDIEVVTDFYDLDGFRYINKMCPEFKDKLVHSIHKAKMKIQQHLDYHFEVIERFNKTEEILKDARNKYLINSLGDNP